MITFVTVCMIFINLWASNVSKFVQNINSSHFRMMSSSKNIIAVCQMTSTNNKDENMNTCEDLIKSASSLGAKMAFLPEGCDYIGNSVSEVINMSEPIEGPLVTRFRSLAKVYKIWLSLGGIHEKVSTKRIRNTHIIINNNGVIVSKYDKIHLFDVNLQESNLNLTESAYVLCGSEIVPPVTTPVGTVGSGICYDLRFPELSLTLTKMGANILTFPSAFTFITGSRHWELLLRARAVENQCYVVAAAQDGCHNPKRTSWGHAVVIDPDGTIIAQCSSGTGIALAMLDLDKVEKVRNAIPVWQHRRNDLYPAFGLNSAHNFTDCSEFKFGQVMISVNCVFYKTKHSIAFTNKKCVVPGHVLVAPIRCVARLNDLQPAEIADLFCAVKKVEAVMEAVHGASSTTITVQDGPEAGQTIKHVHVHILPRKAGDFPENDQIYRELQKHDKSEEIPGRTVEEMVQEAQMLRNFILMS